MALTRPDQRWSAASSPSSNQRIGAHPSSSLTLEEARTAGEPDALGMATTGRQQRPVVVVAEPATARPTRAPGGFMGAGAGAKAGAAKKTRRLRRSTWLFKFEDDEDGAARGLREPHAPDLRYRQGHRAGQAYGRRMGPPASGEAFSTPRAPALRFTAVSALCSGRWCSLTLAPTPAHADDAAPSTGLFLLLSLDTGTRQGGTVRCHDRCHWWSGRYEMTLRSRG